MRLEWLGGAAAIALLATMGSASAAPVSCGMGCVLNATFSPPVPSGLEDYGSTSVKPANGFLNSNPINMGIEHITFMGGTAPGSGLYTGNTPGIAISPFSNGSPAPCPAQRIIISSPSPAVP